MSCQNVRYVMELVRRTALSVEEVSVRFVMVTVLLIKEFILPEVVKAEKSPALNVVVRVDVPIVAVQEELLSVMLAMVQGLGELGASCQTK